MSRWSARRRDGATPFLFVGVLALALVVLSACGGGDDDGGSAARNPTDPRRVPTATVPQALPSPIAAVEAGRPGGAGASLPETYLVQPGDTLGAIATSLSISVEDLTRANPNIDPRGLRVGQELRVPRPTPSPTPGRASPTPARSPGASPAASPGRSPTPSGARSPSPAASPSGSPSGAGGTYTVQTGDTGCAIARRFAVALTALAQANNTTVDGLANLRVGQTLQIPRSTGESPGC